MSNTSAETWWLNHPDHAPVTVTPYQDGNMFGWLPQIESDWSNPRKIQHHAAIVRAETGIDLQVTPARMWCDGQFEPLLYCFFIRYRGGGFTSGGGYDF